MERPPRWITPAMLASPWRIHLRGASRVAINRAAWELASRTDPTYRWLHIGAPFDPVEPDDPAANGMIPHAQLFRSIPPAEFAQNQAGANLGLWAVVRSDEPAERLDPVIDYLRLPHLLQKAMGDASRVMGPGVCVVANCDRIAEHYPDDPADIGRLVDVWRRSGAGLLVTFANMVRRSRFEYDYVFVVREQSDAGWRRSSISCEKAPPDDRRLVGVEYPTFLVAED